MPLSRYTLALCLILEAITGILLDVEAAEPKANEVVIGLDADLSSGSAESGEAIRRGALVAIEELNRRGGMLGRKVRLEAKDHHGNPARGVDNMLAFGKQKHLIAVLGGLHTPVALAELEQVHKDSTIFLVPWAAGTPIIENGYSPNYVFRVSVRDEHAGAFLVAQAIERGLKRPALLLERTGWGRSSERGITEALKKRGLQPAVTEWFHWGVRDLTPQIEGAQKARADAILFVGNAPEGVVLVNSMADLPEEQRLPIISHWGITGGNFYQRVRKSLPRVDLAFLQTFSFLKPPFPERARPVIERYCQLYGPCDSARAIFSPTGTAHAYDLIHLLAKAVESANSTERAKVRDALENLASHEGLVRDYRPPFTTTRHDALTPSDYRLARYDSNGAIVPVR